MKNIVSKPYRYARKMPRLQLKNLIQSLFQNLIGMLGRQAKNTLFLLSTIVSKPYRYARKSILNRMFWRFLLVSKPYRYARKLIPTELVLY